MADIAPELYEKIKESFEDNTKSDKKLNSLLKKLANGKATQEDISTYAEHIGSASSKALLEHMTADNLPDGRIYWNIAERTIKPSLKANYDKVNDYATQVLGVLDKADNIGLKAVQGEYPSERIKAIEDAACMVDKTLEEARKVLGEPVCNTTMTFADDFIKVNSEFRYKAGLSPKIIRTDSHGCCKWCANLAGVYDYEAVRNGSDVFRRHDNCRCTVIFQNGSKRQNVHTKKWEDTATNIKSRGEVLKQRQIDAENRIADLNGATADDKIKVQVDKLDKISNSGMSQAEYNEYLEIINNNPNSDIIGIYKQHADEISKTKLGAKGRYTGIDNSIEFLYPKYNDMNKYGTLAHEYGHFFDKKVSYNGLHFNEIQAVQNATGFNNTMFGKVASSSDEFLAAVRKDRQYLKSIYTSELKKDFIANNASHGVQDAIDGLFTKSRINWGHGERYYNRKYAAVETMDKASTKYSRKKQLQQAYKDLGLDASNQTKVKVICRQYDAASEMWANIMSAETCGGEELEYVKKYLPNSYAEMLKILKGAK